MHININTADAPTGGGEYTPLPPGHYACSVLEAVDKTTKAGTGTYTQVTFVVIEGTYANRRLWHYFNFQNPSQKTVNIAHDQFRKLALACGLQGVINDTQQVVGRNCNLEVFTPHGDDRNKIRNFLPLPGTPPPLPAGGGNAGTPAPAPQPQPSPHSPASTAPPF